MNIQMKIKKEDVIELVNSIIVEFFNNKNVYPFFYLNLLNLGEWYSDRERTENPVRGKTKKEIFMSFMTDSIIEIIKFDTGHYNILIFPNMLEKCSIRINKHETSLYNNFNYETTNHSCGPLSDLKNYFQFSRIDELLNKHDMVFLRIELNGDNLSWGNNLLVKTEENKINDYNDFIEGSFGIYEDNKYCISYSYFPKLNKKETVRLSKLFRKLRENLIKEDVYEFNFHHNPLIYKDRKFYFKNEELNIKEKTISGISDFLNLEEDDLVKIYMNIHFPRTSLLVKHYKEKV